MQIRLNIDSRGYKSKPQGFENGIISNRLRQIGSQKEIPPAQLLQFIQEGRTFTPAAIGGTAEEHAATDEKGDKLHECSEFWQAQQVICADIDNDTYIYLTDSEGNYLLDDKGNRQIKKDAKGHAIKKQIEKQLTINAALDACRARGLDPFAIYKTFSYSDSDNKIKYRVVLILDKPITEFEKAYDYIGRFAQLFNDATAQEYAAAGEEPEKCADTSIEPVKLIFGGRPGCVIYSSGKITPLEALQALPEIRTELPAKREQAKEQRLTADNTRRAYEGTQGAYTSLKLMLNDDIKHFDLGAYIESTTASRFNGKKYNPCPICGHNDALEVNGPVYRCYSENHPQTAGGKYGRGGGIIQYLMQKENLTIGQALEKFKFEIMQYSREEWRAAWIEEQRAAEGSITREAIEEAAKNWLVDSEQEAQELEELPPEYFEPVPAEAYAPENMTEPGGIQGAGNAKPEKKALQFESAADYLGGQYDADIEELKQYAGRKIGLHEDIDRHLTLFPGLAALGGQASLGKTTFAVNIVSKLLERGEHVLYFALEQRPEEIITKSLSRFIYEENPQTTIDNLQLARGVKTAEVAEARAMLAEKLENYHVIECDFETTAADIESTVNLYMKQRPNIKPVVIVDYLQLIAPPADFRGDMRGRVDENLKALKKMQKTNGLFVLVISSFNRSSNLEPISYESFKETSMIEFTCDYVFGLQLQIQDADNEDFYITTGPKGGKKERPEFEKKALIHEEQTKSPKKVQFVTIKNRRGKQYFTASFDYYPAHDYFVPTKYTARSSNGGQNYADTIYSAIKASKKRQSLNDDFNALDDDE